MDAFTMDNQKQIESLTQKVEHLKNNPCCEKN